MRTSRKVSGRRAGEAAVMHTNTTYPAPAGVDLTTLYREIAAMYRDVANETAHDLHFPTGRRLAEALGYPADLLDGLPDGAVTSFAGVGYHLELVSCALSSWLKCCMLWHGKNWTSQAGGGAD